MKYVYLFIVVISVLSFITGVIISIIDKSVRKELKSKYDMSEDINEEKTKEYEFTIINGLDSLEITKEYKNTIISDVLSEVKNSSPTKNIEYYDVPIMIESFPVDSNGQVNREGNV